MFPGFPGLASIEPFETMRTRPTHSGPLWRCLDIVKTILFKQQKKTLSSNKTYMQ